MREKNTSILNSNQCILFALRKFPFDFKMIFSLNFTTNSLRNTALHLLEIERVRRRNYHYYENGTGLRMHILTESTTLKW